MNHRCLVLLIGALLAFAVPTAAQENRAELIEEARGEFDEAAALELLLRAADPNMAPPDSVWAVSLYDLALTLTGMGRSDDAALWLRMAARQMPEASIDREWFPESLVESYDREAAVVARSPDRTWGATETRWDWPDDLDVDSPGRLEVEASGVSGVDVVIEGRGPVPLGEAMELPPGSYTLQASAPGHEDVRLTREVLPDVTTSLQLRLPPALPADVRSAITSSLVRIRAGGDVCVDGVLQPEGLVLTSLSALPRTTGLEVMTSEGDTHDVRGVVQRDMDSNLAVLRLLGSVDDIPVPSRGRLAGGEWAWSVYHPGCGDAMTATTRIQDGSLMGGRAELATPLDGGALGAPVVDVRGSLVGIVVGTSQVQAVTDVQELLARALMEPEGGTATPQMEGEGGGFPIVWVAAGAGVVGVVALLAGGGGGGNGNPNPGPDPTGIRITLPGGSP